MTLPRSFGTLRAMSNLRVIALILGLLAATAVLISPAPATAHESPTVVTSSPAATTRSSTAPTITPAAPVSTPAPEGDALGALLEQRQAEPFDEGLGLRLLLAREIARAHGGTLSATADAAGKLRLACVLPAS